jgi:hypothetical protein
MPLQAQTADLYFWLKVVSFDRSLLKSEAWTQSTYIYRVPQCTFPRRIETLPPPSLASKCAPPPRYQGGGAHSPAGEGLGESQFQRLEKRLSTLPTMWACIFLENSAHPGRALF